MKKYIYYLIIFILFIIPNSVFAITSKPLISFVQPTVNFYINDYANILSSETEEYILNKSVALNSIDGTQIVVVTVSNLDGNSLEEYAYELFNSWGIGSKEKNNGLLLLLALEEREFRVEVGEGLEGILPDGKTGRFQDDYIIPYLKNNDWDNGIKNGYDAFYSEIVKLNNLELDYNNPNEYYNDNTGYYNNFNSDLLLIMFFGMPFIGIIAGIIIKKLKESPRKIATKAYFIIWAILFLISFFVFEILLTFLAINIMFFIAVRYGELHNNWSSGGWSSGSSRGGSSSRSFSGGGGRSSGGGSSRRF